MAGFSVGIDNTSAKRQKRSVDSPITTPTTATTPPIHLQVKPYRRGQNLRRLRRTDCQRVHLGQRTVTISADDPPDPKDHRFASPTVTDSNKVNQPRREDCYRPALSVFCVFSVFCVVSVQRKEDATGNSVRNQQSNAWQRCMQAFLWLSIKQSSCGHHRVQTLSTRRSIHGVRSGTPP